MVRRFIVILMLFTSLYGGTKKVAKNQKPLEPFVWVIGQLGKVDRSELPSEYTMHFEKHPRKYSEDDERLVTRAEGVVFHHDSIFVKFVYGKNDTILYMNRIYSTATQSHDLEISSFDAKVDT